MKPFSTQTHTGVGERAETKRKMYREEIRQKVRVAAERGAGRLKHRNEDDPTAFHCV